MEPTVNRVASASLGVSNIGQVGLREKVYKHHPIDANFTVTAALDVPWIGNTGASPMATFTGF